MLIRAIFLLWVMRIYTCYYVSLMVVSQCLTFWLYTSYKHGSMMCSSYDSCSWIDNLLNGWWMHGLTSVVTATWEGIRPSWWFSNEV